MKIWDWKRQVDESEVRQLAICGFPGWDRRPGSEYDEKGNPLPSVHKLFIVNLELVVGSGVQSRSIAVEWDNQADGAYYYHDMTDTGSPLVCDGQLYRTAFWFQWKSDAKKFYEIIGGAANWMN